MRVTIILWSRKENCNRRSLEFFHPFSSPSWKTVPPRGRSEGGGWVHARTQGHAYTRRERKVTTLSLIFQKKTSLSGNGYDQYTKLNEIQQIKPEINLKTIEQECKNEWSKQTRDNQQVLGTATTFLKILVYSRNSQHTLEVWHIQRNFSIVRKVLPLYLKASMIEKTMTPWSDSKKKTMTLKKFHDHLKTLAYTGEPCHIPKNL